MARLGKKRIGVINGVRSCEFMDCAFLSQARVTVCFVSTWVPWKCANAPLKVRMQIHFPTKILAESRAYIIERPRWDPAEPSTSLPASRTPALILQGTHSSNAFTSPLLHTTLSSRPTAGVPIRQFTYFLPPSLVNREAYPKSKGLAGLSASPAIIFRGP